MNKKLLDKIRGTEKPLIALSEKEWREWEAEAYHKHPVRFWIVENLFETITDLIKWPLNKIYNVKYYIVNRWIDQSHALVAHPKHIRPGDWRDLDYRILHCIFDELVDFVEIEKAYSNYRWDSAKAKQLGWWQGGRWRTRTWRSAEAGLDYLKWESELSEGEAPKSQSDAAKEILFLYDWWVNVRPNRPDPMEVSGWSDYCDSFRFRGVGILDMLEDDKTDKGLMLDEMRKLEEQYDSEDTEMLIRLIKIRGHLWT